MPSAGSDVVLGQPQSRAQRDQRDRCSGRQQLQHVDAEHGRQRLHRLARGLVRPDS